MGIYRAQFRWLLPPERATVERFVARLSESAGYLCRVDTLRASDGKVDATLSFPGLSKNDFVSLSADRCELEFGLQTFLWAHATHCVRELGGEFTGTVISDQPGWKPRQWRELTWSERVRIRTGFGLSIV